MAKTDVIVIGGGISGLSAAWSAVRSGRKVTLIEANEQTGGVMHTLREGDWQVETGPNTLLVKPALYGLMQDLGLTGQAQLADRRGARRYVVVNGRMQALPSGVGSALTNPLVWTALPGVLREPWAPAPASADESVADFVTRRLGAPVLRNFVDPFVSGIFGGDPARLSIHAAFPRLAALEDQHGSILRGAFAKGKTRSSSPRLPKEWRGAIVSFPKGLGALPQRLTERLRERATVLTDTPVQSIRRTDQGWSVHSGDQTWHAAEVIMATPAAISARLLRDADGDLADTLDQIVYAPMCSVSLGFKSDSVRRALDGFGVLIPRPEKRRTLGALFSSTLFAGRTPPERHLITAFVGGRLDPDAIALPDADLIRIVTQDLQDLLGINAPPVWHKVLRWPHAIPQYEVGHLDRMARIDQHLAALPGLRLIGNWRGGISMVDCIANGLAAGQGGSDTL